MTNQAQAESLLTLDWGDDFDAILAELDQDDELDGLLEDCDSNLDEFLERVQ